MWRMLFLCALLLAAPSSNWSDGAPAPTETTIRMKVQPAAAPKPALKYQLLPELREMNPGNPIHEYMRCFPEQHNFWRVKESVANREMWQTMPLRELPVMWIRRSGYNQGRGPLSYADSAARLDKPDWQILLRLKSEGINLLLPDIQQLRELASGLKVRFRVEIAERHFGDAVVTAKTMFALSRHLAEHPTIIGNLVGIAVAFLAIGPLEEMLQQPGCPNLFWALTDLPSPFIDLQKAVQGERMCLDAEFAVLDTRELMNETQLQHAVERLQRAMAAMIMGGGKEEIGPWLDSVAKKEESLRAARQRLIAWGLAEAQVKKFPARQVVLLDEKREYEARLDDVLKALTLPYWQAQPILAALPRPQDAPIPLFAVFLSNLDKVKMSQTRLEQRIGMLRCVEAVRMYAAAHKGGLPDNLDDTNLPLPVDPVTGKPFVYKVHGDTAALRGIPPHGMEANPAFNVRYEVTIGK